jgi:ferritin-like metal-binding protein YciE
MYLSAYLGLVEHAEKQLAGAFHEVADKHGHEPDISHLYSRFASECKRHVQSLQPAIKRYSEQAENEPDRLHSDLFGGTREGGLALLRDLHDLYLMICEVDVCWTLIGQAAQGLQDKELMEVIQTAERETSRQLNAVKTRMKQAAPQTLIAAS